MAFFQNHVSPLIRNIRSSSKVISMDRTAHMLVEKTVCAKSCQNTFSFINKINETGRDVS